MHFENVSATGGLSRYGDLELRVALPPALATARAQLRATLTSPYEDTQRDVAVAVDSAASVRVRVPTPPFYGVVVVKADGSSV